MGSCMSCKAGKEAHEYTIAPAAHPKQRARYYHSMENGPFSTVTQGETKVLAKQATPYTRGQATLFGFKRRSASAVPAAVTTTSTPVVDNAQSLGGSRTGSWESLNSISPIPSGRSTPRLSRLRKDADGNLIRANRFGFRGPTAPSITNKVSDSNYNNNPAVMSSCNTSSHYNQENQNVLNVQKQRNKGGGNVVTPVTPGVKRSVQSVTGCGDGNKPKQQDSQIPQLEHGKASRFTLQTSLLPRPQYPIRLTSVGSENATKGAKTAANNSTRKVSYHVLGGEESSSKEGSLNGDSGIGSHQSGAACNGETDTLQGIEQLDSSPTFGVRRNRKPRTLEVVVNGQYFDVRDLKDEDSCATDDQNVITEISLISIASSRPTSGAVRTVQNTGIVQQRAMQYQRQIVSDNKRHQSSSTASSEEFRDDECLGGEEEKVFRDRSHSEKTESVKDLITPCSIEEQEDWGHGEAMAEDYSSSSDDGHRARCISSPESLNLNVATTATVLDAARQLQPVMLTIEDPLFAAIAAAASPTMIEDETSPVDSLFSSSSTATSTTSEIMEKDQSPSHSRQKDDSKKLKDPDRDSGERSAQHSGNILSPDSPGTPTNASTSLSLSVSEGRDFLIDDEIADQPGLTFDDGNTTGTGHIGSSDMVTSSGGCTSQLLSITENTATVIDSTSKPVSKRRVSSVDGSPVRTRRMSRTGSVDTLSPCESITSDDLMLDYERSEGSIFDCTAESRLDNSNGVLHQLDEGTLMSELDMQSDIVLRQEWSSLLGAHVKERGLVGGRPATKVLRSRPGSTPDSPRSLDPKAHVTGSPLRPPRQATPGSEAEDTSLRLDRGTYQYMYQDIVSIKTMLLKLKRVLQEAETLNPFDGTLKNGLFFTLASSEMVSGGDAEAGVGHPPQEEVADLQRQVVFLQQQLDEKERTIQLLQLQMTKYTNSSTATNAAAREACNAATQTERIRPVSAGPSLLQSLPSENMGPLVSLTDMWDQRRRPSQGQLGVVRQPVVSAATLPGKRVWKQRTSQPGSELVAAVACRPDQTGIPTRKYSAVNTSSTLPRRSHIGSNSIVTKT